MPQATVLRGPYRNTRAAFGVRQLAAALRQASLLAAPCLCSFVPGPRASSLAESGSKLPHSKAPAAPPTCIPAFAGVTALWK
ncbi:MAG TPA: hypothetical protein VMT20_14320 [Terriglobia bacterium]|nr:hypothetical protein [Terriglobia bacterium]